jgi:thiosulfate/3-mercaptopyruvate sulfurtransferase
MMTTSPPSRPTPRPVRPFWQRRSLLLFPALAALLLSACAPPDSEGTGSVPQEGGDPLSAHGLESTAFPDRGLDWAEIPGADDLEARRAHFLVGPEALARELEDGGDLVVLEIGMTPEAFEADGHVAGAHFLPWDAVAIRRDGLPNRIPPMEVLARNLAERGVGEDTRIVLYDRDAGLMAGRAWAVLDYVGLGHRTRLLDGQLRGWEGAGGATETGPGLQAATSSSRSGLILRPRMELLADGDRLADLVWARETQGHEAFPDLHLLDARPPAEHTGAEPGGEIERPGHIPGARNLPWRSTTGPDEAPFLLEAPALLALFEDVGVAPGDRIITYCRTGGQAGHLHFVARMLGFEVRFYDGSFVEWSQNPERPVVGPDGAVAPALTAR